MKNLMKKYMGNEYTDNHLRNFCLYWMKAADGSGDEWRSRNDLDCLYFDGDLRADTLMSAWTPIKWVADCLNKDTGKRFYKKSKNSADPFHDLRLLADDRDAYLPPRHELVRLLDRFLSLAEERCNFILLPDRRMNTARYSMSLHGEKIWLFDEVPATLSQIFHEDSLGQFFDAPDSVNTTNRAVDWVRREHLEMGFADGVIDKIHVLPLFSGDDPQNGKWLADESEIREALDYMIRFLESRKEALLCDEILNKGLMELYRLLREQKYLWVTESRGGKREEHLYSLDKQEIYSGEIEWAHDLTGIEVPDSLPEIITLYLKRIVNGKLLQNSINVRIDRLHDDTRSAHRLMSDYGIRIPSEQELAEMVFDVGIPSVCRPVPMPTTYKQRRLAKVTERFLGYLKRNNIPYVEDTDGGKPRFTFSFRVADTPGEAVESCIWFYEDCAEVRTYYSAEGAMICRKSTYRNRLLALLNYINARVFLACSDGGSGLYAPQMLYTPRMYMTEDGCYDITITTIINFEFWNKAPLETADYITAYCPELLEKLAVPVFEVLRGNWPADRAIRYVNERILQDGTQDAVEKV